MQTTGLEALPPQERARVIYTQARSEMNARLWQAAIGGAQDSRPGSQTSCPHHGQIFPTDMMALLGPGEAIGPQRHPGDGFAPASVPSPFSAPPSPPAPTVAKPTVQVDAALAIASKVRDMPSGGTLGGLGPNAQFADVLQKAAQRSGLPPATLAAIVDAEAAKRSDGTWNLHSRNPRSSAAGLGQFLSGTWIGMAQTPGNWLHDVARQKGWLTESGRVVPAARGSLLAMRYDAQASINSIADYARSNIATIRKAGVATGDNPQALARIAYLGHHLGPGDAIRYLKGGLSESRAAHLLKAQIGSGRAIEKINRTGDAAVAHREWLSGYVDRKIRPDRFAMLTRTSGG
ncbi:peptidoglycan-binding protein [Alteriqipengyuania sp. 357]